MSGCQRGEAEGSRETGEGGWKVQTFDYKVGPGDTHSIQNMVNNTVISL